jgi:hypothetical protein
MKWKKTMAATASPRSASTSQKRFRRAFAFVKISPRQALIVYPQIPQISADLDLRRANKERESAKICVICG